MDMAFTPDQIVNLVENSRPYDKSSFVDRLRELEIVQGKVKQIQDEEGILDPLVNFWGVSKLGKTWLLRFLYDRYHYSANSSFSNKPTFALFASLTEITAPFLTSLVINLAADTLAQLSTTISTELRQHLSSAQQTGDVDELVHVLQKVSTKFVPIILLDDAEAVSQERWLELEQHLLEPLLLSGRVLFVVAGRRPRPQWHRFEVRRRVMETKETHLGIFPKSSVEKLLRNRHYNIPLDLFFPYTAGSPHLVDVLGQLLIHQRRHKKLADQIWLQQQNELLRPVLVAYQQYLLKEVPADLHNFLQAVAPLRSYRLEALRFMIEEPNGAVASDGHYMRKLRELDQKTTIVWWSREHKAYITDDIVRRVVNYKQLLVDRAAYERQHQRAIDMYWRWARKYSETSEDFLIEIWFHAACLYQFHHDSHKLQEEIENTLGFAREFLQLDRFIILKQQIDNKQRQFDYELCDLLPESTYRYLTKELEHIQNKKEK